MTDKELLINYRLLVIEIETLERQSKFLNQYIGGPRPVRSPKLTGMPRGTNDPEAALLQRADTDDALDKLEEKCMLLRTYLDQFERILDGITDRRMQIIIRNYYALGMSDEAVAELLELSQPTVNRLRNDFMEGLE